MRTLSTKEAILVPILASIFADLANEFNISNWFTFYSPKNAHCFLFPHGTSIRVKNIFEYSNKQVFVHIIS